MSQGQGSSWTYDTDSPMDGSSGYDYGRGTYGSYGTPQGESSTDPAIGYVENSSRTPS